MDMTVILINNMIYGMTGGQVAPTTPVGATASTTPHGNFEETFNLPYLAESCGAVYVARWTAHHVRHLTKSIREALAKKGFSFIEILAPCPTLFSRRNKLGDGLDQMKFYRDHSEIKNGADTKTLTLDFQGKIVVGKFVDKERPTYLDAMNEHFRERMGDKYVPSDEMKELTDAQD
jgi:2-oxoglutarate ferredoxin oxidoreductase subunit beta